MSISLPREASEGMQGILPYEGDCLDARLAYPDSYSDLPAWATSEIAALNNSGRKFYLTNYPFLPTTSQVYPQVKNGNYLINVSILSIFAFVFSSEVLMYSRLHNSLHPL